MKYSIFFSYSWKDRPIAMRIYDDLVNSGLSVWRDQVSGNYGVNIYSEVSETIKQCEGYILLDSSNSRQSDWVKNEYRMFEASKKLNPNKKIAICLVEDKDKVHTLAQVFEGHNLTKYYDFSEIALYDNQGKYNTAISQLCSFWNKDYVGTSVTPSLRDFEDEISIFDIREEDRRILLSDYEAIKLRQKQIFSNVDKRLEILLEDCEKLNISVASPYIALATLQINAKKYEDARTTFFNITKKFPYDPRGWRGLGSALFELTLYKYAIDAFDKAIVLTEQISRMRERPSDIEKELEKYHEVNHKKYLNVTKINKAASYARLEQWRTALEIYKEVYYSKKEAGQIYPELFLGISHCYEELKKPEKMREILLEGLYYFPGDFELNREFGQSCCQIGDIKAGIKVHEFLVKRFPSNIEVHSELLFLLKIRGLYEDFKDYYFASKKLIPVSSDDFYYMGHIEYMVRNYTRALEMYQKSDSDFPYYSELWE